MKSRPSTLGTLKKLPPEMRKGIFRFFTQNDLHNIAQVNKTFLQIRDEEIDERRNHFKDNIFYTLGSPIRVSDPYDSSEEVKAGISYITLSFKLRKNISNKEVSQSFPGHYTEPLKLFKTEEEALEYSVYLRNKDRSAPLDKRLESLHAHLPPPTVLQSAIFKVICLHWNDDHDLKQENLTINKNGIPRYYSTKERVSSVAYFEAERLALIPLEGILKIHCSLKDEYLTHGPIYFNNLGLPEEEKEEEKKIKKTNKRCSIS